MIVLNPGYLSIGFLMASIVSVWLPVKNIWATFFTLFLVTGVVSSWISPVALISISVLATIVLYYKNAITAVNRYVANTLLIVSALIFGVQLAPGIDNIYILKDVALSNDTGWSALRFSADKPIVGLFLLLVYRSVLLKNTTELWTAIKSCFWIILVGSSIIYLVSIAIGFTSFDWTPHSYVFVWFIRNLIFTVIAEELIFRSVIQGRLENIIKHKYNKVFALVIASVAFGAVHIYGGWQYGLLATLAGLLYGYCYQKTGKIEMAMLAHVSLNTGHLLLLSYP